MTTVMTETRILDTLSSHRSRSSVAAIGHRFVLNCCPADLQIRSINMLTNMICDWSVAILEELIEDPKRNYLVRQYAVNRLRTLLFEAIDRGYAGVSRAGVHRMADRAITCLSDSDLRANDGSLQSLCDHLMAAVEEGCFPQLPDF